MREEDAPHAALMPIRQNSVKNGEIGSGRTQDYYARWTKLWREEKEKHRTKARKGLRPDSSFRRANQ